MPEPTEAQVEAVRHVRACRRKDCHKILKLGPVAEDPRQERENTLNSVNSLVCLVHPRFNKTEGAEEASKSKCYISSLILATNLASLVSLKAAKKVGVSEEEIKELRDWDGKELEEVHSTTDGRWVSKADSMEGVESDLKQTEIHRQILHEPGGAITDNNKPEEDTL